MSRIGWQFVVRPRPTHFDSDSESDWEWTRFLLIMHVSYSKQNSTDWLIDTFNDLIKTQVLWYMEIDALIPKSNLIGNCNLETKMTRSLSNFKSILNTPNVFHFFSSVEIERFMHGIQMAWFFLSISKINQLDCDTKS